VESAFILANQLQQLGQPLYRKMEPTGYSTVAAEWTNSAALLARMNFALALTQNRVPGLKVDPSRFEKLGAPAAISKAVLFTDAPVAKDLHEAKPAKIAGLIIGGPEFQRR